MSKVKVFIVIAMIASVIGGCGVDVETSNFQQPITNDAGFDSKVQSVIGTASQSVNLSEMEEVYIRNIDDHHYLIGFKEEDSDFMNFQYRILNTDDNTMVEVNSLLDYVTDVKVVEGQLYFISDGENIINGFREFPSQLMVDLETGALSKENLYDGIGSSWNERRLGNYLNETKLISVETSEDSITYHFGPTKETILAGGMFCPNIMISSKEDDTLTVDIENLMIEDEQIRELTEASFITAIEVGEYEDALNCRHLVQTIYLENKGSYTCEFIEGNEGFMDFVIRFR